AAEDAGGLVLGQRDRGEAVDARIDVARLHEVRVDVRAADVHADAAAGERLVDVAPAVFEVGAHRVVRPPHRLEQVQGLDRLRVVERRLRARARTDFHPATEGVD